MWFVYELYLMLKRRGWLEKDNYSSKQWPWQSNVYLWMWLCACKKIWYGAIPGLIKVPSGYHKFILSVGRIQLEF